jgi:hypothetical protein
VADTPTAAAAEPFDIEQPACFYLGREYDLAAQAVLPDKYVMYDARDLTTHGVIVGMTGSGKTGLSIALLEEAAIDGIPSIIIDPKGDLTNLLLQFPDLDPKKFEPWINEEDAQQKKQTVPQYAAETAARWRRGLDETGQSPDRIARLRAAADWRIYTPGSATGLALSILGTFSAPQGKPPREVVTQKVDAVATALLGLTGIAADPVQSREHILVAQLLLHSWDAGRDLDLAGLIRLVENPPLRTVGTYSLETFFPAKDRVKFAATLNNVLAAPSFATWTTGEPLDLSKMLYRNGRPQQLIFYTAHLDDTQRMFFTTLLLEEVLSWTRKQVGTTNLRALLYFDEVFGYLPPHPANPPSKGPLLTLLKQARAFGVGVLLATQNPVDLDYKALSNAGTWFVGKLQTERDKARLLEGLEGAAAERGTLTDRGYLEKVIASLGNRVFLLHDVHRGRPVLFQTRWALSFLRGPLTREQVGRLMEPLKSPQPVAAIPLCTWCHAELPPGTGDRCPNPACGKPPWARSQARLQDQAFRDRLTRGADAPVAAVATLAPPTDGETSTRGDQQAPVLPPDVKQFYLPTPPKPPAAKDLEYTAGVLGFAEIVFIIDKRSGKDHTLKLQLLATPAAAGYPLAWDQARPVAAQLQPGPAPKARWDGVPDGLDTGRKLKALEKAFGEWLAGTQKLALFENRTLGLTSAVGETQDDFQKRCRDAAAAQARAALDMEKAKFQPKFAALGLDMPRDPTEGGKKGSSVLGWLFGAGSAKTAPASPPSSKEEEKQRKLEADYQSKQNEIREKWRRVGEEAAAIQIKPRKADVRVTHFGLGWAPRWK